MNRSMALRGRLLLAAQLNREAALRAAGVSPNRYIDELYRAFVRWGQRPTLQLVPARLRWRLFKIFGRQFAANFIARAVTEQPR